MATQAVLRLTEAFPDGVPSLDPVKQLHITDMEFVQMRDEREKLESTMNSYTCTRCPDFEAHVSLYQLLRLKLQLYSICHHNSITIDHIPTIVGGAVGTSENYPITL